MYDLLVKSTTGTEKLKYEERGVTQKMRCVSKSLNIYPKYFHLTANQVFTSCSKPWSHPKREKKKP